MYLLTCLHVQTICGYILRSFTLYFVNLTSLSFSGLVISFYHLSLITVKLVLFLFKSAPWFYMWSTGFIHQPWSLTTSWSGSASSASTRSGYIWFCVYPPSTWAATWWCWSTLCIHLITGKQCTQVLNGHLQVYMYNAYTWSQVNSADRYWRVIYRYITHMHDCR